MFKQNNIAEIRIRAERRAGEMLSEQIEHGGDRKSESSGQHVRLKDIEITEKQSSRWQGIASLPEKEFEEHIIKTKADKKESLPCNITKKASHYAQIVSRNLQRLLMVFIQKNLKNGLS
jgi:hypothetical protein